jgi:hypothetical protein
VKRLLLILFLLTTGFSVPSKTPPKKSTDAVFIQVWMLRSDLEQLRIACKTDTEVTLVYSDGVYVTLPCLVVNK